MRTITNEDGKQETIGLRVRKKPVCVDAIHYNGGMDSVLRIAQWMNAFEDKDSDGMALKSDGLFINTLEGEMLASKGDYIIRGVDGEYYPCKPGIFHDTYQVLDGE